VWTGGAGSKCSIGVTALPEMFSLLGRARVCVCTGKIDGRPMAVPTSCHSYENTHRLAQFDGGPVFFSGFAPLAEFNERMLSLMRPCWTASDVSEATLCWLIDLFSPSRSVVCSAQARSDGNIFVSMATRVEAARDVRLSCYPPVGFWTSKCFPDRFMNFDGFQD
jgi:hypothetical protein